MKLWFLLNEHSMLFEEGAEEESQVLDEVLLIFLPILVRLTNVCA